MKRRERDSVNARVFRALERVERAAVDVTNEIAVEVEPGQWTKRERALMRAIERYEDVAFGIKPARRRSSRGGAK